MLRNFFIIAFRNLLKFKGFSVINIAGLALGLASAILIMVYVLDELSFDKFHAKENRIYRVNTVFINKDTGAEGFNETNAWPIGDVLKRSFPEVEETLYVRTNLYTINQGDRKIQQKIHFISDHFFDVFSFQIKEGNPKTMLIEPFSLVITEDIQRKFFGNESALNKILTVADTLQFTVTGVIANMPTNSHIQSDVIASFSTYQKLNPYFSFDGGWGNINMKNYILLKEGTDPVAFAAKARNIYSDRAGEMLKNWGIQAYLVYEPLKDIYLRTKSANSMGPKGSIGRVYLLEGVAAFIMLLACINFINLSTARSVYRAKEVGLRKVIGSTRQLLIRQFLSESFFITLISFFVGLALMGLALPLFNQLLGKNYGIFSLWKPEIVAGTIGIVFLVTLLSGLYPAWVISSLRPAEILKGKFGTSSKGSALRSALVIFQFTISVILISATLIVVDQLNFMQKKELGFAKDEIFVMNIARVTSKETNVFQTFKHELEALAIVKDVSFCGALPSVPGWKGQIATPEGKTGDDAIEMEYMAVDENYVKTLGLKLVAGRNFDPLRETDMKDGLLINEAAVPLLGWHSPENAIGKKIESPSKYPAGTVIGVVKDYHEEGLQQTIGAMALDINSDNSYLYAVRYSAAQTSDLISATEKLWKKHFPGYDFKYFFLDQNFENQYQSEQRLANVFSVFSGMAVIIALIGVFGLTTFLVVSKTKEIGVRKVLGASVYSLAQFLSKEFVLLIIVANAIAIPIAWYFANSWLENFAYRMSINPMIFITTALTTMIVTLACVSYQTIKAAMGNPVESLKSE